MRRWLRPRTSSESSDTAAPGPDDPLIAAAETATEQADWRLAATRWRDVVDRDGESAPATAYVGLARAHHHLGDIDAVAQALASGRDRHPNDVRLLVDDARASLRAYRRSDEDERHHWKARLLRAVIDLQTAREDRRATKGALITLGEIQLALRRWDDAIELWSTVGRSYADRRIDAAVGESEARRHLGDFDGARATLETLTADQRDDPQVRAELGRVATQLGRRVADELVDLAHLRIELGDREVLARTIPVALAIRGYPADRAERLTPLIERLSQLVDDGTVAPARGDVAPTSDGRPAPEVIHVCGFLYSGSGAVFDHLREREDVHLPFDTREVGFLKKANDLGQLMAEPAPPPPGRVAACVLSSGLGFGQTGRPLLGYFSGSEEAVDRFVVLTGALLDALASADPGGTDHVLDAVRTYLDAIVAERTPPERRALMNNAVIGHQLDRLRLFSRATAVAVLRDPRDQFVSQRLESPYPMALDPFLEMMHDRLDALEKTLEQPDLTARVIVVGFEDYVQDQGRREVIMERLGLPPIHDAPTPTHFRPQVSARNIGIHHVEDTATIDTIQRSLLDRVRTLIADRR